MIGWGDSMWYLFVEGPDDERLIASLFAATEDKRIYQYSNKRHRDVAKFIKVINQKADWKYVFFTDSDTKNPCDRKNDIKSKWPDLDEEKIIVVCIEIESWYYAGMSQALCEKYKIKYQYDANNICKEQFTTLIAQSRLSRHEILIEAATHFDINLAQRRNSSFKSFYKQYVEGT